MKISIGDPRFSVLLLILSVIIFVVCLYAFFSLPIMYGDLQQWSGYYTLLLDSFADSSLIAQKLERKGYKDLTYDRNTLVHFFSFDNQNTAVISQIDQRLDELDPRLDPFIRKIISYFEIVSSD
ncbi:MAG: hypothetical protein AB1798_21550, partial [Spirochaetota bacterium]